MNKQLPTAKRWSQSTLANVDLRQLRVFNEIVRCNGFSAAQSNLGMTQATISAHMAQLEQRLGVRLCERGRSGFYLTAEGMQVHSATLDLFGSIEQFQSAVAAAKGELTGRLSFATVDAVISNQQLNLQAAIREMSQQAPKIQLDIDIAAPQALAQGLLNGRYQIVLMPEQNYLSQMRAETVFFETQNLYCGAKHPLFALDEQEVSRELLQQQAFAGRSYQQPGPICDTHFQWRAVTAHMESTLLLLLSGAYIGFLPDHYAAAAVEAKTLRALAPSIYTFKNKFEIVHAKKQSSRAAELFVDLVLANMVNT